jgi:hypothetical protein
VLHRGLLFVSISWWILVPSAEANELLLNAHGPRSIGRAGVSELSGDLESALLGNPSALARRSDGRARLAFVIRDSDLSYDAGTPSPVAEDRGQPLVMPSIAAAIPVGQWIVSGAYTEPTKISHSLSDPVFGQDEIIKDFPFRYAGTHLAVERRALIIGAARRFEWLAFGVSAGAEAVKVRQRHHLWAGFSGREPIASPERDLVLNVEGTDGFVPRLAVGALLSPADHPFEIAAHISYRAPFNLSGTASAQGLSSSSPTPLGAGSSSLELSSRVSSSLGVRFQGRRYAIESSAGIAWSNSTNDWTLSSLQVRDETTGAIATVEGTRSLLTQRNSAHLGFALDVEVVPDFALVSAGYSYNDRSTQSLSPVTVNNSIHAIGAGVEIYWERLTLNLAVAYEHAPTINVSSTSSRQEIENPFNAGSETTGAGSYSHSATMVGLSIESSI